MTTRANAAFHYRLRIFLFAVGCLGMSAWMFYDALIAYPLDNVIAAEYETFKSEGRLDDWPAHARAKGWPDGTYGEPKGHTSFAVNFNLVVGIALLPVGLACAMSVVSYSKRWYAIEDQTFATSGGLKFDLARIHQLDLTRWHEKGIAWVLFDTETGDSHRFVLDDWKFDRDATREIVKTLIARAKPEQIVGNVEPPKNGDAPNAPGADAKSVVVAPHPATPKA